jgi:hypothetical protein
MTDEEALFKGVHQILERRHRVSDVDHGSGTIHLHDDDRTVRVHLAPDLLAEYFEQLDEHAMPELAQLPKDAQNRLRTRRVTMYIEELFESDLRSSLLEIRLIRSADGRISLVDRRGPARRSVPWPSAETGHWSPDRPST